MSRDQIPNKARSIGVRVGALLRGRLAMRSGCLIANASAISPCAPPGSRSFSIVTIKWTTRMNATFMLSLYQGFLRTLCWIAGETPTDRHLDTHARSPTTGVSGTLARR